MFSLKRSWNNLCQKRKEAEKQRRQAALDEQLKQSFYDRDFSGMEQALKSGANPNFPQIFAEHPFREPHTVKEDVCKLFLQKKFQLTFLDILYNTNFFAFYKPEAVCDLFIRYGGKRTEEGQRDFAYWKDVESVWNGRTPKEFYCKMGSTCQQLKGTTKVGKIFPRHIELPEKCCPHWDCPNRDRSTFGMYFANGRWWKERY